MSEPKICPTCECPFGEGGAPGSGSMWHYDGCTATEPAPEPNTIPQPVSSELVLAPEVEGEASPVGWQSSNLWHKSPGDTLVEWHTDLLETEEIAAGRCGPGAFPRPVFSAPAPPENSALVVAMTALKEIGMVERHESWRCLHLANNALDEIRKGATPPEPSEVKVGDIVGVIRKGPPLQPGDYPMDGDYPAPSPVDGGEVEKNLRWLADEICSGGIGEVFHQQSADYCDQAADYITTLSTRVRELEGENRHQKNVLNMMAAEEDLNRLIGNEARADTLQAQLDAIRSEVSCRIDHGADSNGHLEGIQGLLIARTESEGEDECEAPQ